MYALTRERDALRREQSRKSDAAALLKEKDEIISQVMAEGNFLLAIMLGMVISSHTLEHGAGLVGEMSNQSMVGYWAIPSMAKCNSLSNNWFLVILVNIVGKFKFIVGLD